MLSKPSDREQPETEYAIAPGMPVVVRIFRERAAVGGSTSAQAQQARIAYERTPAPVATRARRACAVAVAISVGMFAAGTLIDLVSAITP